MTYADEARLIKQAQTDPAAFAVLYDRHVDRIYGYAYRQTQDAAVAEDITSATFEKALRSIPRFQWRGVSIAAWLYRIARNEIAQHYRRERFLAPLTAAADGANADPPAILSDTGSQRPTESVVQSGQRNRALHRALSELGAADRDVLTLRFLEQLSTEEVAAVLGCTRSNVYVRLHRALQRLRQQLELADQLEEVLSHA